MSSICTFALIVAAISHQFARLEVRYQERQPPCFDKRPWSAASFSKSFFIRLGCRNAEAGPNRSRAVIFLSWPSSLAPSLGRRPPRYSETFDHPDVAIDDFTQYGKVAAVG
jgi:hypothetical protein